MSNHNNYDNQKFPDYYPLGQCSCGKPRCPNECIGPRGAQGTPGPTAFLSGMQVQLTNLSGGTIADNEAVLFNSFLSTPSSNITYSAATRLFTITKSGTYYINWWINTDGAGAATSIKFSIIASNGLTYSAVSGQPITSLQLGGNALVSVTAPATFSLVNETNDTVFIATAEIQADLTIIEVAT